MNGPWCDFSDGRKRWINEEDIKITKKQKLSNFPNLAQIDPKQLEVMEKKNWTIKKTQIQKCNKNVDNFPRIAQIYFRVKQKYTKMENKDRTLKSSGSVSNLNW